ILFKWWERRRFFRALRMARISVGELHDQMSRGPAPVVVDVRSPTAQALELRDRKSTRLNSSHLVISYAVFCLKKKNMTSPYVRSAGASLPLRDSATTPSRIASMTLSFALSEPSAASDMCMALATFCPDSSLPG